MVWLVPSGLARGLGIYPGLSITGIVGQMYQIDYSETPQTNSLTLAQIVLPTSPYLRIDTRASRGSKRFYRASAVQP